MANSTVPAAQARARPKTKTILLIEDEEAHVELIRRAFVESPEEWLIHHAATFNEAIQWLAENETTPPSLILADYLLPDGKGIDMIEKAKKLGDAGAGIPVIILTAYGSEELAVQSLKSGAVDYVTKTAEHFRNLPWTAERELRNWENFVGRKKAEEKIRQSEKEWRDSFNSLDDIMLLVDTNFTIERVNKAAEELIGKGNLDEIIGGNYYKVLYHRDSPMENCPLKKALKTGKVETLEQYEPDFDKYMSTKCSPVFDANGNITHLVLLMRDVTERRRKDILEAQSELQSLLTDAIPLLLKGAPPEKANMFIHQMCNNIEAVLWKKHLAEVKAVDMSTLGTILCRIMNEMGGDFELESVDDKKCIVKGNACPWGTQAQRNPVLCMLCRGIFSRLASKVFTTVAVNLIKTIGNKDDYCIINIQVYGKV